MASAAVHDAAQLALATSQSVLEMLLSITETPLVRTDQKRFCHHLVAHCVLVQDHVRRVWLHTGSESTIIFRLVQIYDLLFAAESPWAQPTTFSSSRLHQINQGWSSLRPLSEPEVLLRDRLSSSEREEFARYHIKLERLSPRLNEYDAAFCAWHRDLIAKHPDHGADRAFIHQDEQSFEPSNEVRVHTNTENMDAVQIIGTDEAAATRSLGPLRQTAVKELCRQMKMMREKVLYRLELKVEGGRLFRLPSQRSSFRVDKKQPPVSLQHLLRENPSSLTERTKRILAVLLSYAVYHLRDTSWLKPDLDSSHILFFRKPSTEWPLIPYLQAQLKVVAPELKSQAAVSTPDSSWDGLDPDEFQHPLPELVTLSTILMELHFAKPFDVLARDRRIEVPGGTSPKWFLDVATVFEEYKSEIPRITQIYHVIERCLDPEIWRDCRGNTLDNKALRTTMYKQIVWPFEDELCKAFDISMQEVDMIAEKQVILLKPEICDSNASGFPFPSPNSFKSPTPEDTEDVSLFATRRGRASLGETEYQASKFFDDETLHQAHSTEEVNKYAKWQQHYRDVYNSFIDEKLIETRVKIAVLDSGVDQQHYLIDTGQIKNKRNWTSPRPKETQDRNGHGTFTAGLIIEYAPDAELYVAKIADKSPGSPETIAEAIRTAVDEWDVDIISMSFGYPTNQIEGYGKLNEAILHAYSRNVLMFAAASNDGANRDRAYPAQNRNVICVHSTDSDGNRSKFSPTAHKDDRNIATIGEAVQSAWPVVFCDEDTNPEYVQTKSGTSFATPILAGIAAFLLQYARIHLPEQARLLRQQSTMKEVLVKIAEKTQSSMSRDGYHYVALNMFADNLFGKGKEFVDVMLKEILKH
ncbi:hypothetical protein CDD80_5813 [Ophiocordyceps camponoti-rufipedis]|uniref:Uncharacterized protein n=1 Tax=Ophiocordyceps camponoti-rufipedis TaxID=2004952 RepID=A0A2C5ZM31_9HYPO|nr:hypothetical protein CDD80_5813 [Ophiocordyceps camponoti-rufipedis]